MKSQPLSVAGAALLLAVIAGAAAGCGHMIIHDVKTSGDAWTLRIDGLTDGPDGFSTGQQPLVGPTEAAEIARTYNRDLRERLGLPPVDGRQLALGIGLSRTF
jgi:hypothetical protein